ncbi:MAG TPA: hypothetical protein PL041_02255 [Melioribacteraceae bacterium]|nr:hypothetical protein [Melioribacteraceae bacterium]
MICKRRVNRIKQNELKNTGLWFARGYNHAINTPIGKSLSELTVKDIVTIANTTIYGKYNACTEAEVEAKGVDVAGKLLFTVKTPGNPSYKFTIHPNLDLTVSVFGESVAIHNQAEYITYIKTKLGRK